MIGRYLARGSFGRRIVTRAVVVLGAVLVGGQVMRNLPHEQTLIFPVGSSFPNAKRFSATWQVPGSHEPSGGVTLSFTEPPPLQIRQHTQLPNGDYIVAIAVVVESPSRLNALNADQGQTANTDSGEQKKPSAAEVQTTVERRVTLAGGETIVALPANASLLE